MELVIARAASKANEVFCITELLEHVLLQVNDLRTLLLAQRVCREWRNVIGTSDQLQKKLFLKPATLQEAEDLCMSCSEPRITLETNNEVATPGAVLNCLVTEDQGNRHISCFHLSKKMLADIRGGNTADSSWGRMYFSQPPCHAKLLVCIPKDTKDYGWTKAQQSREWSTIHGSEPWGWGWVFQDYDIDELADKPVIAALEAVREFWDSQLRATDMTYMFMTLKGWRNWFPDRQH